MIALPLARESIGSERLRHAAIAILLAVLAAATTILRPLDITVWSLQAKLFDHSPTSEFVFVEVEKAPNSHPSAGENRQLLQAIRDLDEVGVERIILDMPILRSNSLNVDTELRETLRRMADKVILTRAVRQDFAESQQIKSSDPFFAEGLRVVSNDYQTDFVGFVWGIEPSYSDGQVELPALWSELAKRDDPKNPVFTDYSVNVYQIPRYELDRLRLDPVHAGAFSGKTIVLGPSTRYARTVKIPDGGVAPSTLVHILAAETAVRGSGRFVSWIPMLGLFGFGLIVGLLTCREKGQRRLFYVGWLVSLFVVIIVTAKLGIRALFAETLALAAAYAVLRAVVNFKRRHLFFEASYPTFSPCSGTWATSSTPGPPLSSLRR